MHLMSNLQEDIKDEVFVYGSLGTFGGRVYNKNIIFKFYTVVVLAYKKCSQLQEIFVF